MAKYRFELKSPGFGNEFLSGKGAPGQYLASWFEIWKIFKQKLTPPPPEIFIIYLPPLLQQPLIVLYKLTDLVAKLKSQTL